MSSAIARYNIASLSVGSGGLHARRRPGADERDALVEHVLRRLGMAPRDDLDIDVDYAVPPGSGLGCSSATVVALVRLLDAYDGGTLEPARVAALAGLVEREDLGVPVGLQDHFSAAYGGLNFIEFHPGGVSVEPLDVPSETLCRLEDNLVLASDGRTRRSGDVIADQTRRLVDGEPPTVQALMGQAELAHEARRLLLAGHADDLGAVLSESWRLKRRYSPLVETEALTRAYDVAIRAGVLGGKVTGAGGGGHLLCYCGPGRRSRVTDALQRLGMRVTRVRLSSTGALAWCPTLTGSVGHRCAGRAPASTPAGRTSSS